MAILQLFPVSGLSIAAALYMPSGAQAVAAVNAAGGVSPDYGSNFGIAAAYAMPDLLSVKLMYRTNETTMGATATAVKLFSAGVNVSAVKGLTLNGDVQANLSNSSNTVISGFVSVGTSMFAPLTAAVDVAVVNSSSPSATNYAIEANLEYTVMAPWAVGANIGYDSGSATGGHVGWFNQGVGDWTGFEIYPYVKASFDNGSSVKIGVVYATAGRHRRKQRSHRDPHHLRLVLLRPQDYKKGPARGPFFCLPYGAIRFLALLSGSS